METLREAYVTMLTDDGFLPGAQALLSSIAASQRPKTKLTAIPTDNSELRLHRHRSTPTACNNPAFKTAAAFERFLGPISGDTDTL